MTGALAVVIPIYEEKESIEKMLRAIESSLPAPHLLVMVYDLSLIHICP